MATFTITEWKAAFKTILEARAGLDGVTVYDAEQSLPDIDREAIVIGNWETTVERLTFGVEEETNVVTGRIRIVKPDTAKAARDRAMAVLTELKAAIDGDETATATIYDSRFLGYRAEEGIWPENGRVCELEYQIGLEAHG